jgi:hypothetical protein
MEALSSRCRRAGRDPATLEIAVSLRDGRPEDVAALAALGVTELVLVEPPPAGPGRAGRWVSELAERWGRGLALAP